MSVYYFGPVGWRNLLLATVSRAQNGYLFTPDALELRDRLAQELAAVSETNTRVFNAEKPQHIMPGDPIPASTIKYTSMAASLPRIDFEDAINMACMLRYNCTDSDGNIPAAVLVTICEVLEYLHRTD